MTDANGLLLEVRANQLRHFEHGYRLLAAEDGQQLLVGVDLRLLLGVLQAVLLSFFDYGNVFNSFHVPHLLQYGAGIGFRVRLPVMTLGIDVGEPLSQPGSPRLYINFSPRL